ncbi:MAG: hypothetical protein COB53_07400 [Elusimicrobia bacterium]|nr:MAG: hypothetical protein COB53_07400 [Elusimicrobiota bacterium]
MFPVSWILLSSLVSIGAAQPRETRNGREMEMPSFGRPTLPPDFGPANPSRKRSPAPVPVPRPVKSPEPTVIPVTRLTPPVIVSAQSHVVDEFLFLRSAFSKADSAILESLFAQAAALLEVARQSERADEIQLFMIEIRRKQKRPVDAVIEALKLLYEYPGSKWAFNAKRIIQEITAKRFKRSREKITAITEGPRIGMSRPQRLGAMLQNLASFSDPNFYSMITAEFRDFFKRYPGYTDRDSLSFLLAGLHTRNGSPRPAVFLYERILALSEKKDLKASAQNAVGDLYAGALDDPERAVGAYQALADGFPEFEEAQVAYGKWARLLDKELKQPMLAVEILEKAVQLYPETDAAHNALSESGRILAFRLKNRELAVLTLERLAEMFPGPRAVAGLRRIANLHARARDYAKQARTLVRLRRRYPGDAYSAEALWTAARLYDKKLRDETAARRVYQDLVESYPENHFSKKARRRLESLE